jgi:hypothetical protein
MENYLQTVLSQGQGRAPNTIKLRKNYNAYAVEAQSNGEQALPFEEWAKMNYPDMKILSQGG